MEERTKLYGSNVVFVDGEEGMKKQESWIRNYAKERCGMDREAELLRIVWYPAFYLGGFGSIFPKVDLCNYIPRELVDVAILEEPEHLNWFRAPMESSVEDEENVNGEAAVEKEAESDKLATIQNDPDDAIPKPALETSKLGWTHRFRFVVGIVHTNYEAYARQYGVGASLIAAPAIGALSAMTIRAYCHQVIKLSDTLPSFAPGKECTCNVHGVRREFLEGKPVDYSALLADTAAAADDSLDEKPSAVYFIGKLVWAKGFDLMLDAQDVYRKKNKEYFPIDIYGSGPEETSIARAFHGRNHTSPTKRPAKRVISPSPSMDAIHTPQDLNAAAVFANPASIKDQTTKVMHQMKSRRASADDDVVAQYLSLGFEVSKSSRDVTYVKESRVGEPPSNKDPINILGDLSSKSVGTGMAVSTAVYNIADSSIKNILKSSFRQLKRSKQRRESNDTSGNDSSDEEKKHFVFDPPQSRWELRRYPVPAKFPGVIDHAQLISVPHKIFLNPSTSEVLCTTTAEALAMGKFVILPKHPSNEFFLQFTNCLAYETLEECADKLKWAMERNPAPLSEQERHKFTWEAATERLISSWWVRVREARERAENGMDKTDARIAFWLSQSGEKGNMVRSLFTRKEESS